MRLAWRYVGLIGGLILVACPGRAAMPSEANLIQARDRLSAEIQRCSSVYHFNPDAPGLPQRKLAQNELAWRHCAYQAIKDYQKSNSTLASLYNSLINEDILMTNAFMHGQVTRSEWRATITQQLTQINAAEQKQIEEAQGYQSQKQQQLRDIYNMFRSFTGARPY
ncbi:MAG: hypothetical protein JO081_15425 [Alphaproteobacteria bacterium]|nr:hypothetical protein [Alphaproteobacteria bacterium]